MEILSVLFKVMLYSSNMPFSLQQKWYTVSISYSPTKLHLFFAQP